MADPLKNSLTMIRNAYADHIITSEEALQIEDAVLKDEKIEDAEVEALNTLLNISFFESPEIEDLALLPLKMLNNSRDVASYRTYNLLFWNFDASFPSKTFWPSPQNSPLASILDTNNDGELSVADILSYKHPRLISKPDCQNHHSPQHELPFEISYPQWNSLVYFLRAKILEGPESLQKVREFMMITFFTDPERFEFLLDSFNVYLEPPPSRMPNFDLAMMAIETSLARVTGAAEFSNLFGTPMSVEDLEIPIYIRPRSEADDPSIWGAAAYTSQNIVNDAYKVSITVFNDSSLRETATTVHHEMKHGFIFQLYDSIQYELSMLIVEPLANYWDYGDAKITLRFKLVNTELGLVNDYISKIYEQLQEGAGEQIYNEHQTHEEYQSHNEHFEGNVLFYVFERHYGKEGLKKFCRSLVDQSTDSTHRLEKASQAMAGKTWAEVLHDFKMEGSRYLQELREEEGGAEFNVILHDYFQLSHSDWFSCDKVNALKQLSVQTRSELKIRLHEILSVYPNSAQREQIYYLIGQIALFEGNFSEARDYLLRVIGYQDERSALYGVVCAHIMEGNLDLALQLSEKFHQLDPEDSHFSSALEDISKNGGEGIRTEYFNFYYDSQKGGSPPVNDFYNSLSIVLNAYQDSRIDDSEFREIEKAVLADNKIDEQEEQLLNALSKYSSFESSETESSLKFLAESKDAHTYRNYLPFFSDAAAYSLSRTPKTWTYQGNMLDGKIDANEDGTISVSDVLSYKHPKTRNDPHCPNHLSFKQELPFDFSYPQWNSLMHFLRGKISSGDEAIQGVREFLTELYRTHPEAFENLLNAFNIHFKNASVKSEPRLAMIGIETCIARTLGKADFVEIFDVNIGFLDLDIPLYIALPSEEDPATWSAQTQSGMLHGAFRVFINLFSNRANLKEQFNVVQHELKHALVNKILGYEKKYQLPLLIREPLANFWDDADRTKEIKNYMGSRGMDFNHDTVEKIHAAISSGEFNAKVSDEHLEGNILFHFLERHYGINALKKFCHALVSPTSDGANILEKASQAMAGKTWKEVLSEFKTVTPRYLSELREADGGADFNAIIQEYFNLLPADWFHASKVNELRRLSPEIRRALAIRLEANLLNHPDSMNVSKISYLLGQIAMFQMEFEKARNHFLRVNDNFTFSAAYAILWSHVLEDNFDLALEIAQKIHQDYPEDDQLALLIEDLCKHQGGGLKEKYLGFYFNSMSAELPYYLGEE